MILNDLTKQIKDYDIKKIEEADYQALHALHLSNTAYNAYFDKRPISLAKCIEGTKALPPNTSFEQKFYIGFHQNKQLVAVLDYVEGYPKDKVVWIGLLMIDANYQRQGIARKIVQHFINAVASSDYQSIQLGVIAKNSTAFAFWQKMGFIEIDRRYISSTVCAKLEVIIMERFL